MNGILILLDVAAGAVVLTVLLALGQRWRGELTARRLAKYQGAVQEHLTAFVAGARDDPPPPPANRFEQRVMRQDLVAIAPQVKGEARRVLAGAFADYGLIDLARRDLDARDGLTRIRAAEALGSMQIAAAEPWLRARLHDGDPLFELACAPALADLGAADALPRSSRRWPTRAPSPGEVAEILLTFGGLAVPFLRARCATHRPPSAAWPSARSARSARWSPPPSCARRSTIPTTRWPPAPPARSGRSATPRPCRSYSTC